MKKGIVRVCELGDRWNNVKVVGGGVNPTRGITPFNPPKTEVV